MMKPAFRMMHKPEICFACGEQLEEESQGETNEGQTGLLCEACARASEKPSSHYYMMQYYYRFAD